MEERYERDASCGCEYEIEFGLAFTGLQKWGVRSAVEWAQVRALAADERASLCVPEPRPASTTRPSLWGFLSARV
jgi:hypothetical protein